MKRLIASLLLGASLAIATPAQATTPTHPCQVLDRAGRIAWVALHHSAPVGAIERHAYRVALALFHVQAYRSMRAAYSLGDALPFNTHSGHPRDLRAAVRSDKIAFSC